MKDTDLDDLLAAAGSRDEPLRPAIAATVDELVANTVMQRATALRSRKHRLVVAGVITASALALTAGTTMTAAWLQIPPFQSLPVGYLRTHESVPVRYTTLDGQDVRCRSFLEFERTDAATVDRIDAAIAGHDWTGFGQGIYDALPAVQKEFSPDSPDGSEPMISPVTEALYVFAKGVVPDLVMFEADGGQPGLAAVATTCRPDAQ